MTERQKVTNQLQSLQNFVVSIRSTMEKTRDKKNLTDVERNQIVQFYLEVAHVVGSIDMSRVE